MDGWPHVLIIRRWTSLLLHCSFKAVSVVSDLLLGEMWSSKSWRTSKRIHFPLSQASFLFIGHFMSKHNFHLGITFMPEEFFFLFWMCIYWLGPVIAPCFQLCLTCNACELQSQHSWPFLVPFHHRKYVSYHFFLHQWSYSDCCNGEEWMTGDSLVSSLHSSKDQMNQIMIPFNKECKFSSPVFG